MVPIDAAIAANRFGLGARPRDELEHIGRDPRGWLRDQIQTEAALAPELAGLPDSAEILRKFQDFRSGPQTAVRRIPSG